MIPRLHSSVCSILAAAAMVAMILLQVGPAQAQTVTRAEQGNDNYGLMFDVQSNSDLTVTQIVSDVQVAGSFELYARTGSFVGHESSSAGWALVATASAASAGPGQLVFTLTRGVPAGQSVAFYIVSNAPPGG